MASKSGKFSIDDAFEADDDDIIRTYGSTIETAPLQQSSEFSNQEDIQVTVHQDRANSPQTSKLKIPSDNISRDSDSLIHGDHEYKFNIDNNWWRHPKVRQNWRVVVTAFGLLLIGSGLLVMGIVAQMMPSLGLQGFVFFVVGVLCFIPGVYHVVYVYLAAKGRPGYSFYNLPLFN